MHCRFRFDNNNCAISRDAMGPADVIVKAFNRRWYCHRSVLSQSNYFSTLFNGSFRESKLREIELHTHDERINEKSLELLIDAIYDGKMTFEAEDIFNVTATAQYFQMDAIVEFCEAKLRAMVTCCNAIEIYLFAEQYFLKKTMDAVFEWMLLRLFPVTSWSQLNLLTLELAEKLISHPRLVTQNEFYLYIVLKMLVQIEMNGTCEIINEAFYKTIKNLHQPFLVTKDGARFRSVFSALKLGNILVRRDYIEVLLRDNIIPRSTIDRWVFKNWMALVSIESPENFGPSEELVTKDDFEMHAMRFSKIVHVPDFHSWKFVGFSFAFDLAMFFDGRNLIIKRVHQINEHKVSHSHLLRRIMLRWDIAEMNSSLTKRQKDIRTITMTTNEEICLVQLPKEPKYPARISVEVLFHIPYKADEFDKNLNLSSGSEHDANFLKSNMKASAFKSCNGFFN